MGVRRLRVVLTLAVCVFSVSAAASSKRGGPEARQADLFSQAEEARVAGHADRAGALLSQMPGGYWSALGYLNLAADYTRTDRDPVRALVALRVALALAGEAPEDDRAVELIPRILLRAGYLSYRNGEYDKAIRFLERIPLDDYITPHALYIHGLCHAARKNYRAAMQSWHRATKYPLAYSGVAEAWIALARGYDLSGYLGQAGESFLAANAAYESERVTLRTLADEIRDRGAYRALVLAARQSEVEWFLADSRTLTQPRMAYLLRFLESATAQQAVQRVASLDHMASQLAEFRHNLAVYQKALADGAETNGVEAAGRPATRQRPLVERYNLLVGRYQALAESRSGNPEALEGIRQTLADLNASLAAIDDRMARRQPQFDQWHEVAGSLALQTGELADRVNGLRTNAEASLDRVALAFLDDQQQRMVYALNRTEQQIAHLYEHLAVRNLERGTQ